MPGNWLPTKQRPSRPALLLTNGNSPDDLLHICSGLVSVALLHYRLRRTCRRTACLLYSLLMFARGELSVWQPRRPTARAAGSLANCGTLQAPYCPTECFAWAEAFSSGFVTGSLVP